MEIRFSDKATKSYKRFPPDIKKKVDKQLRLLTQDWKHLSLNVKKMPGKEVYEARVDWHYRMAFLVDTEHQVLYLVTIGQHDEGLGKK